MQVSLFLFCITTVLLLSFFFHINCYNVQIQYVIDGYVFFEHDLLKNIHLLIWIFWNFFIPNIYFFIPSIHLKGWVGNETWILNY